MTRRTRWVLAAALLATLATTTVASAAAADPGPTTRVTAAASWMGLPTPAGGLAHRFGAGAREDGGAPPVGEGGAVAVAGPGVAVRAVSAPMALPALGWPDLPNPFADLGEVVAKAAADAWTAAMLAIWNSGLFVLRIALTFSEVFLVPDLSADGPGRKVYAFTLWSGLALVVILTAVQLGAVAFTGRGKGLARAFLGAGQFVVVCACWFGYGAAVVTACGALTRALMSSLLRIQSWPEWDPLGGLGLEHISDAAVATVLAFLGIFLWIAAIGHLLVYLARAASLLILTATGPLSAAGLVAEFTRAWFWKSLRWFHAAAFTPVLMVLVLGVGVQLTSGVAAHQSADAAKSVATALPAVMLILVSVVAPLALFKLLAFVDPGTASGASFRQGLAAQGGLQGLLGGSDQAAGSTAAATSATGRSTGEESAEGATEGRFAQTTGGLLGGLGPAGQLVASGLGKVGGLGAKATSLLADAANQSGVGHPTYGPDFSSYATGPAGATAPTVGTPGSANDQETDDQSPPTTWPPAPPTPPTLGPAASGPGPAGGGTGAPPPAAGPAGVGGAAAGGAGAAAIPPVA